MALEFTTSARRKWGVQATVRGNGPFAVCSICYTNRLVWLFETREARDEKWEQWERNECGAKPYCFANGHQRADLKGYPETELGPAGRGGRIAHV